MKTCSISLRLEIWKYFWLAGDYQALGVSMAARMQIWPIDLGWHSHSWLQACHSYNELLAPSPAPIPTQLLASYVQPSCCMKFHSHGHRFGPAEARNTK